MRALIADDDRTTAMVVASALRGWKFDVTVCHDGEEAWNRLRSDGASLAILDWMMPGLDGPELCRRLRLDPSSAGTYVILLTARDSKADQVSGLDAGADDYLVKPFDREELRARVQVGARVAALQAQLTHQVAELQGALATVKQLEGLIRICSYCKRIGSDADSWEQLEAYISEHTNAEFSHGICPSCLEKALVNSER